MGPEGQEEFPDPLEIGSVVCQIAACGHTGGHDENELKKTSSTLLSIDARCKTTHIVYFDEWVDSAGLSTVPPFVGLVDNIL